MPNHPTRIGKYKILSLIGVGGMGAVYQAEHPTLKRTVIIKKLTPGDNQDFVERFKREASIMMDFRNERIVQVYDHFKEGGAFYIVMEYVNGITLEQLIADRRYIHPRAAMLIFREICLALKYAHDQMVLHRDIKPANILLSRDGVVKLVDFGVSATLDVGEEDDLTRVGMTIGTPSYLAPEQIANAKNRDKRSDIYSAGVVFYEMVVGKKPYPGGFTPDTIALIQKGKYLPPRRINPRVPPSIQRIIRKMMHHKVKRRYQDLEYVINKLSKRLKSFRGQEMINAAVKRYLENTDDLEKRPTRRMPTFFFKRWFWIPLTVIIGLGAVGIGLNRFGFKGYLYEYFFPERYGALRISLNLREGFKSPEERYIRAFLYREEDGKLHHLEDISFDFQPDPQADQTDLLISKALYLEENPYTVVVYIENEQYRENFYLFPRQLQKTRLETGEGQHIQFDLGRAPRLPVHLNLQILDYYSGQPVSEAGEALSILHRGRWIPWDQFIGDERLYATFTSHRRYQFRFQREGYFTRYYHVTVRPQQTDVTLKLKTVPVPGEIHLRTQSDKPLIPLINNSRHYLAGGRHPRLTTTVPLEGGDQTIRLPPGRFFLTIKRERWLLDDLTATRQVVVASGESITVNVDFDKENKSIDMVIP